MLKKVFKRVHRSDEALYRILCRCFWKGRGWHLWTSLIGYVDVRDDVRIVEENIVDAIEA